MMVNNFEYNKVKKQEGSKNKNNLDNFTMNIYNQNLNKRKFKKEWTSGFRINNRNY
jgi:hypothetical protein